MSARQFILKSGWRKPQERLYHRVRADEETGVKLFQEMAEELTRYRLVNRLRALLSDVNTYPLECKNSSLWRDYYNAQLAHLETRISFAENAFRIIGENTTIDPQLRSYALCELGKIKSTMGHVRIPNGLSELALIIEDSNKALPQLNSKRAENYVTLGIAYPHVGEIDIAHNYFEKAIKLYQEINDMYGVASVFRAMLNMYGICGDWNRMFKSRSRGLDSLPVTAKDSIVYSALSGAFAVAWTLAGRYAEAEEHLRITLSINKKIGIIDIVGSLEDLAITLGFQGKYSEAHKLFDEAIENTRDLYNRENPVTLNFYGMMLMREGTLGDAENVLLSSLAINEKLPPRRNPPENLHWIGLLYEIKREWQKAEEYNRKSLEYRWIGRQYYVCGALTSLVRVKHSQGDIAAIPSLLAEAEQLAQQYEYNDHLASLCLTQGHLTSPPTPLLKGEGSEVSALDYYKQAMIYALRYNRFLLDELLSGRPQGTPLRPIIPYCLERREEGRKILLALRDWWQTGVNDVGTPRPDTISPIPEGIPLLDVEKIAREREPGDGSMQKNVIEQLEAAFGQ
jgi:tetratricopeptide (TPR) repeat protein